MTAHFKEEELLYLVTLFFFQILISILSKLKSNFKLKKSKIQVKRIQNNDCIVDTSRLFFETQGRKYGRNLSWPCANLTMEVSADNILLPPQAEPKYLGVTLDRSLTYRTHIEDTSQKLKSRVSIIRKLTGTGWGASQSVVLRISALSLCYSVAEYAAPVWMRSAHAPKEDTQLNEVMRLISRAIRSTSLNWLPTMNNIAPPMVRRETANQKSFNRIASLPPRTPIVNILAQAPDSSRLISRRPFYKSRNDEYSPDHHWKSIWAQDTPVNGDLINDPTQKLPGF